MDPRIRLPLLLLCAAAIPAGVAAAAGGPLFGFAPETSSPEQTLEQRFDARLDAGEMIDWLRSMSSEANNVGTPKDKANALWVRDQFRNWGWTAEIEQFDVLYPTLKRHSLELTAPTRFVASLSEPPIPGDATSARTDGMDAYNVYGADGDINGELVYVNYGMDEDYKELAQRGVDVKGKIVIVRYGGGWRGLKPKLAQEHGSIGCIIYSDPRDDGYVQGDVYPKGGWRPPTGVQRGSVEDLTLYPGDPLTPGVGATKGARRLAVAQARTLMKIPVMPISYADAEPLLAAIGGPLAPDTWRGSLPMTYHLGPGPATVHMAIDSDWSLKTLYDVIARIPGADDPDTWVVRANHRDGWVYGAWDPLSGHTALLAEAKSIGALVRGGWKPKRTIVYASWDAEEPGTIGSTEWAETHADELQRKAVLYVNTDDSMRGFLSAGGSHSLQHFVTDVAEAVTDPEANVSVAARSRANTMVRAFGRGASEGDKRLARSAAAGGDLPLAALGSGSDFSVFLQHLGIASLNFGYGGEGEQAGVYHSKYDTFEHYMRFGDPGLKYGVVLAKTVGRVVLRMADADVLPMQFGGFADAIGTYVEELRRTADEQRRSSEELGKLLDQNAFGLAADPSRVVLPPARQPEVPYFEFAALDNAVARLKKSAKAYDDLYARFAAGTLKLGTAQRKELDDLLRGMEQTLTDPRGLPGRDWYRHLIYAPGTLTGYGAKTLPGVREGIEQDRFEEASRYIPITAGVLMAYCNRLDRATAVLRSADTAPRARAARGPEPAAFSASTSAQRVAFAAAEAARPAAPVKHVFLVVLENQSYGTTFGANSRAPFLAQTLPAQGALVPNYYGIGHSSLPNYIALIGAQAPNRDTQLDCPIFSEFRLTQNTLDAHGQALGRGCVYPSMVKSLADQLEQKGLSWKAYMEDMGNDPSRESPTCGHVPVGAREKSYNAAANDKYAARHNPFLFFHAVIDDQSRCDSHIVNLKKLAGDLQSAATTANYSFITPNLCNDGHDPECTGGGPGGMTAANAFLEKWVPLITGSPAFRNDGLLIVTFDETDMVGSDGSTACCNEEPLAGSTYPPGLNGPGGGRIGAVMLSPFIKPGTVSNEPYNHYSLLRTVEDFFGLEHLGYAAEPQLQALGPDVFTNARR